MKTLKERKKRNYHSIFDPFRKDIEKWCDSGMTLREAHEQLPAGYSYQGFYTYVRVNQIREGAWAREVDARRVCDKCKFCKKVKNTMGTYNVADNRLCTLSWRLISCSVKHCPRWCEYEGTDIEERINGKKDS